MSQIVMLSEEQKTKNWRGSYQWLMALFYFLQGLYYFGTNIYIMTKMANWHMSTGEQTTVTAILGLPLYLKVLPALVSDRMPVRRWGRRKPYIIFGALLYIPGFTFLLIENQFGPAWIGAILLTLVAWMLVDGAFDGMVVDITPAHHSAKTQSACLSGRLMGMGLAGLVVPLLGPRIGWMPVLVCLGTGALIQSTIPLFVREIKMSRQVLRENLPLRKVVRSAFSSRLLWLSIFFFIFFSASIYGGTLLSIYTLSELGWSSSPETMANYGMIAFLTAITGAAGAFLLGRLPGRYLTSFQFYAIFQALFWCMSLLWLLVHRAQGNMVLFYITTIVWGAFSGFGRAISLALRMRVCPKSIEGFTFALMGSVVNIGNRFIEPKTVGALSEPLGSIIPALFSLIPYGLISLFVLNYLLRELARRGDEATLIVA